MSAEIEKAKASRQLATTTRSITGFSWKPQPLAAPKVHPELTKLDAVTRSAEVIRYSVRTAEYWLSPDGRLREWFRLVLFIAVVLGIPAAFVVPIVTSILTAIAAWVALLVEIIHGLATIAACLFAIYLVLWFFRKKPRAPGRRGAKGAHS